MKPETTQLPDLPYRDPVYRAHEGEVRAIHSDALLNRTEIEALFDDTQTLKANQGKYRAGRSATQTAPIRAVMKDDHLYCELAQRLFHNVSIMAYHEGAASSAVTQILERMLSTRISMLNFPIDQKPVDHRSTIRSIDNHSRGAGIPSMVPYLYTPNSALRQLKVVLGEHRFKKPELLYSMGELYSDTHVLHSICMTMASSGEGEGIDLLLKTEAMRRGKDLFLFLYEQPPLLDAYLIGCVECGKVDEALTLGKMLLPMVKTREAAAEKYATALRAKGQFDSALRFLREVQAGGLDSKALAMQFSMARNGDTSIFLKKKT